MALYKRGTTWWCDFVVDGVRTRRSLGTDSAPEAKRRERELIAERRKPPSSRTLHDALGAWLDERPRGRSDISILNRLNGLPNPVLDRVNSAWCREHLKDLLPANYNRHTAIIRSALNLAVEHGWIDAVPAIEKRREPTTRERYLTRAEWTRLHAELPEHLRDIAEFALLTGLRQENVLRLQWSQVDLVRRTAWIHAADAKGRKAISVPLAAAAVELLKRQVGQHDTYVFTHGKARREPYTTTPKTAWLTATKAAGLEGLRWHDLRHTWASWHVQSGTPLGVLQKLGGWASLDMVHRYAHFAPEHLAAYADNASNVTKSTHDSVKAA
jgi:integrase